MVAADQGDSSFFTAIETVEDPSTSSVMIDSKEWPKTNDSSHSVTNSVSSVVTNIVNEVSTASALENEKARVQKLINDLVTRTRDDSASAARSDSKTVTPTGVSPKDSSSTGVPVSDYRPRKVENLPLEWTQARHSVTLHVRVPSWVTKRHVTASFETNKLKLLISGQSQNKDPFISLEKTLFREIDEDGSVWALDAHAATLLIELEKIDDTWWSTLFEGDDPATYRLVDESCNTSTKTVENKTSIGAPATNASDQTGNGHDVDSSGTDATADESIDVIDVTSGTSKRVAREDVNGERNGLTIEKAVAGIVENVVSDASVRKESCGVKTSVSKAGGQKEATTTVEDDSDEEIRPGRATNASSGPSGTARRVLTRADLPKLIEESKATVEKGGAHAAEAAIQLATFYHYGIGVKQDDAEAVKLFRRGLEGGVQDSSAAFQLGLIYNTGAPGVTPDAEEAVKWWRVAASYRNAVAMFNLGVMAMNGTGCEMDPVAAMDWFQRAKSADPKLDVPQLSRAQLDQRVALAGRLRRQRKRREVAPEEWQHRKEEALKTVRVLGYTTAGLIGLGLSMVALRYWWRNRL